MDASKQHAPQPQGAELLDPERASVAELEEALARYDELPPAALERIAAHPEWGARLRVLQLADAWLREQGPSERPATVARCPEPDELFDYGRGPGARPLAAERRAEIDRHVLACADCRGLSVSLARRPPAPLDLGDAPAGPRSPARAAHPRPAPLIELAERRRRRRVRTGLRVLAPLAAAAALLVFLGTGLRPTPEPERGFPIPPTLRGSASDGLVAPRGAVLVGSGRASWAGLAERPAPRFELAAQEGAEGYRIELLRHSGGALEAGELVAVLEPTPAGADLVAADGPPLAPGRYTWRAFASIRGLERELGARDFEVRPDPELEAELAALARAAEPARSEAAIRLLDAAGHLADARALARTLPASPERDAYLDRVPGR